MPILKIQKEITQADIDYMADAIGYAKSIFSEVELEPMTMQEFEELKNTDRNLKIKLYKSDNEVLVVETIQKDNPTSRAEYLAEFMQKKLNNEIETIMLTAEKQKLQFEIQKKEREIAEGVKQNVVKTPLEVKIINN